jgi:hypothetical protein
MRVVVFVKATEESEAGRLPSTELLEALMSGRHFRPLLGRYDEEGAEGLRDRRLDSGGGRISRKGWRLTAAVENQDYVCTRHARSICVRCTRLRIRAKVNRAVSTPLQDLSRAQSSYRSQSRA